MTDLTRAEIEKLVDDCTSVDADFGFGGDTLQAITQLLRQLDAAEAENIKLARDYNVARDAFDAETARADAAAEQMRERCKSAIQQAKHDNLYSRGMMEVFRRGTIAAYDDALQVVCALPLHKEPKP